MVQDIQPDGRPGFAERLKQALTNAGYPDRGAAVRLAKELRPQLSERAVGKWLNAESMPDTKRLDQLSSLLGVSVEWLLTGRNRSGNVAEARTSYRTGLVPVISWVRAGHWHEAADLLAPGDAEDWRPCPVSHGLRTYALRVVGDSMTAPHGKSYPEGCLIFVDPDRLDPPSGAPIIAKVNGDDAVTFKILVRDAGRVWLRALNPAYPPIQDGFRVLGTVIGKWEDA